MLKVKYIRCISNIYIYKQMPTHAQRAMVNSVLRSYTTW